MNGDQIFLLSAEEANNPDYGFSDDADRAATLAGQDAMWWLRSPHSPTYPLDVGMVFTTGSLMDFPVNGQTGFSVKFLTCARPACNLDIEKISAIEKTGTTDDGATIWKLTLTDDTSSEGAASGFSINIILIAGAVCIVLIIIILLTVICRRKKS